MSELAFIEKLLDGVEVEWKTLGDIAEIYGGLTGKSKADFDAGNAKFITYKNIFSNSAIDANQLASVRVDAGERQNAVSYGDVLFTGSSEIADEAGMSSVVTTRFEEAIYLNSFSFGLRFSKGVAISPEFSKHLFRSQHIRSEISRTASGVTRFNISKARFKKIEIPILCPDNPRKSLEIQAEIVRILDAFTELTTELTAELTTELAARKRQYNHYRDQLLRFEKGDVEWKTLEAITTSIASGRNKARFAEGTIPVYGSTGLIGFTNEVAYSGDLLLVARVGANAGRVNSVSGSFDVSDNTLIIRPKDEWNIRFAFHQLTHMNLNQYAVGGGQPLVTGGLLKSLQLPLPSLKEQERIAGLLDKFDARTNSLTEGLPREIALRQKQYEYYRDLLLSFSKSDAVEA
jgi:type I restriction enzyme S subunit